MSFEFENLSAPLVVSSQPERCRYIKMMLSFPICICGDTNAGELKGFYEGLSAKAEINAD